MCYDNSSDLGKPKLTIKIQRLLKLPVRIFSLSTLLKELFEMIISLLNKLTGKKSIKIS